MFASGVREINLIGQDTTSYGEDLGIKDGLANLMARLAQIETERESGSGFSIVIRTGLRKNCWTPSPNMPPW